MIEEDKEKKPFRLIFASVIKDLLYIAGFFFIVFGVYQIDSPSAYITAGVLCLLAAVPKNIHSKNNKTEK